MSWGQWEVFGPSGQRAGKALEEPAQGAATSASPQLAKEDLGWFNRGDRSPS